MSDSVITVLDKHSHKSHKKIRSKIDRDRYYFRSKIEKPHWIVGVKPRSLGQSGKIEKPHWIVGVKPRRLGQWAKIDDDLSFRPFVSESRVHVGVKFGAKVRLEESEYPHKKGYMSPIYDNILFGSIENDRMGIETLYQDPRIPIPLNLEGYVNLAIDGKLEEIYNIFTSLKKRIIDRDPTISATIKDIQLVFGIVRNNLPTNTLDYEIYNEIENLFSKLHVALEENKEVNSIIKEIDDALKAFVDIAKETSYVDTSKIILEDTGQTIGENIRIFKKKKN
jgi:hypothetical protein